MDWAQNFFGRSHTYLLGVKISNCFYLTKLKFALLSHLPDWMTLPHSKCGRMSWNCACTSSSMLSRCLNILRIYGRISQLLFSLVHKLLKPSFLHFCQGITSAKTHSQYWWSFRCYQKDCQCMGQSSSCQHIFWTMKIHHSAPRFVTKSSPEHNSEDVPSPPQSTLASHLYKTSTTHGTSGRISQQWKLLYYWVIHKIHPWILNATAAIVERSFHKFSKYSISW